MNTVLYMKTPSACFKNHSFSHVAVHKKAVKNQNQKSVSLFNRNVYKKTAHYDSVPVEGTEEYAVEFHFFRAKMTVLVCPENGFLCIDLPITCFITLLLLAMLIEIDFTFLSVTGKH